MTTTEKLSQLKEALEIAVANTDFEKPTLKEIYGKALALIPSLMEEMKKDKGWFIPELYMSGIAQHTFALMMQVIGQTGGQVDVHARIDGKIFCWQCDGLKYAKYHPPSDKD